MIEDREIWACAHQVMRQYGDAGWFHAAQRADELLLANDQEGSRTWLRILRCITEFEKQAPQGAVH